MRTKKFCLTVGAAYLLSSALAAAPPRSSNNGRLVPPKNLRHTAVSPAHLRVEWDDVATGETGYRIWRREAGGEWYPAGTTGPDVTHFDDGGMKPSTNYEHRVAAIDDNGAEESAISPSSATRPMVSHLTAELLVSSGKTYPAGPSSVLLNSGELLLAYQIGNAEKRRNHAGESIWLRTSRDGRTGWLDARLLFGGNAHTVFGKSALVRMQDGRLGMAFSRWTCDEKGVIVDRKRQFVASADEGKTWSEPVDIGPLSANNHTLIVADKGRLLEALSDTTGVAKIYGSDDHGGTWRALGSVPGKRLGEAALAHLGDGRLVFLSRHEWPFYRLSFSNDNGVTWEKTDAVLPLGGGDNPPKLVVLPDGKTLAAVVHSWYPGKKAKDRRQLAALISRDGGRTWDNFRLIGFAPDGDDGFLQHSLTFVDNVGYLFYGGGSRLDTNAGKDLRLIRLHADFFTSTTPWPYDWQGLAFGLLATPAAAATGTLSVQVRDAETGELMPARLVIRASDGTYPGDRLDCSAARWPGIEAHAVFMPGQQSFKLPVGKTSVIAARGLEYHLESQTINIEAGKTASLSFRLKRMCHLRQAGWVSGDAHVHMLHGENQRETSYQDVATTCAGNGLDFVSVGQEYVGAGRLNLAGYEAACDQVSTPRFRMLLGGELPKSLLGHHVVLGIRDPFEISEDPPYYKTARKIHALGGVMIPVHPVRYYPGKQYQGRWLDFPGNNLGRELIFGAYCGPSFDGLSVLSDEPSNANAWQLWFQLLNRGCFVPIFADSDACFDRPTLGLKAPGFWSTFLQIGADTAISHQSLSEAVRRGRTIATTGPLLQFKINGRISGSTLPTDGQKQTVEIEAWYAQHAFSLQTTDPKTDQPVGVAKVELIRNGKVIKTWEPNQPHVKLTHAITELEPCWYVARVYGTDQRWQVGAASPIYFASQPVPSKREPMASIVRGRIYDFKTGEKRSGTVEIRRDEQVLLSFSATGQFRVKMPLDAEIIVRGEGVRPIRKNLLLDYAPVHRFLWYLESKDFAKAETFDLFEHLVQSVDLEFPLGARLPGSYVAEDLSQTGEFKALRINDGPAARKDGTVAIAAVLLDTEQIQAGDTIQAAAIYRDEGDTSKLGPLVVEARGYDPARPTAYGALKKFAEFEKTWQTATDLSHGYKMIAGQLKVAEWVQPGPTGGIDLSIRARQGNGDAAWLGLHIPLGPTKRALSLSSAWPTMPISWPDGRYGVGPFQISNRVGRSAQSKADYRQLHLEFDLGPKHFNLHPARDAHGCPDADDATFATHYLDQVLSEESHLAKPDPIRPQPEVEWQNDVPLHDATTDR